MSNILKVVFFTGIIFVLIFSVSNAAQAQTQIQCNIGGTSGRVAPNCNANHIGGFPITHIRHFWSVSPRNHASIHPEFSGARENVRFTCTCKTPRYVRIDLDYDTVLLSDSAFLGVHCPANNSGVQTYNL